MCTSVHLNSAVFAVAQTLEKSTFPNKHICINEGTDHRLEHHPGIIIQYEGVFMTWGDNVICYSFKRESRRHRCVQHILLRLGLCSRVCPCACTCVCGISRVRPRSPSLPLVEGHGRILFCTVVCLHVWLALPRINTYHIVVINRSFPSQLEAHHWPDH